MWKRIVRRGLSMVMVTCALVALYQNSLLGFPDGAKDQADRILGPLLLAIAGLSAVLAIGFWRATHMRQVGRGEWLLGALALTLVVVCLSAEPVIRDWFPVEY